MKLIKMHILRKNTDLNPHLPAIKRGREGKKKCTLTAVKGEVRSKARNRRTFTRFLPSDGNLGPVLK